MPGHFSVRPWFLVQLAAFLSVPLLLFGMQEQGPQRVQIPVMPKANASKHKADRGNFPKVPVFKDVAAEVGLTASHIAAPQAMYVIDSTSGGSGLFDCDGDGRLDAVVVNGSTVEHYRSGRYTRPSFMTYRIRRRAPISWVGSPSTAIRSASNPRLTWPRSPR